MVSSSWKLPLFHGPTLDFSKRAKQKEKWSTMQFWSLDGKHNQCQPVTTVVVMAYMTKGKDPISVP